MGKKAKKAQAERLFENAPNPAETGPVECLGMTFANDEARRAHFTELLRQKLRDPEFRAIPGFPVGDDEHILAMSNPPYYTACPNPWVNTFIEHVGRPYIPDVAYHREPFTTDVTEGKTDPIYAAHAYHTKVPHKAIMRYILHYTDPGDIVFDGFCGSGMTGVAAQLCADRETVSSLKIPTASIGARNALLNDLSPAATFVAANYGTPIDAAVFQAIAKDILRELESELGWMYQTTHKDGRSIGRINYTVWSDTFTCGECGQEIVFTTAAVDLDSGAVLDSFPCSHCGAISKKEDLELRYESLVDKVTGHNVSRPKRVPTRINYTLAGKKFDKVPDADDFATLRRVQERPVPDSVPELELPDMQMMRVGRMQPSRISHIHHFFLHRSLIAVGKMWQLGIRISDYSLRQKILFLIEQSIWTASLLNRYRPTGYSQVNQFLTGVFYVPSQHAECSPWYILDGKVERLGKVFSRFHAAENGTLVTNQDLSSIAVLENSVDYIFTDPPFGENIYYSDLNILVESWHGVRTASENEVIVDRVKRKTILDYQRMMSRCFANYYRILKPGRWMTVEFHNSRNSVWNAIQEALQHAGFVVADVRTLDKQQGSFQQVVSGNTVKRDLIISAYKPNGGLEERFREEAGTESGVWDFVRTHLRQLPVFVCKDAMAEQIAERKGHVLFDRMVAFHVQRGYAIPLSTPEFLGGLAQHFFERDGMYFLLEQAAEYDRRRREVKGVQQPLLFVNDEKSAIAWVRKQLSSRPLQFKELQPIYMKDAQQGWDKHEQAMELRTILEQNFVQDTDGTWRVPDPQKESDLEQLRHRALLKEFQQYLDTKGRLKVLRTEALRAGFKECWQKKDYATIVTMAKRVPDAVIQEDPALLMYFDNASLMLGE